jgi:hypothetical protein
LQSQVSEIQSIIKANPALRFGTQQIRDTQNGVLVATRYLDGQEYLVAFNGADESKDIVARVETVDGSWKSILGQSRIYDSQNNQISLSLPARSYIVLKADKKYLANSNVAISSIGIHAADFSTTLQELSVKANQNGYLTVSFAYRTPGSTWKSIGSTDRTTVKTDQTDGGLYRVFFDLSKISQASKVQLIAVAKGPDGKVVASPIKEMPKSSKGA